jgi:DNA-directed RNA polymerase II subunit RPB2
MDIDMDKDIIENKFTQKIIDTYFEDNPSLFVSHHLDSYNDFYNNGIKRIIREKNPIVISKEQENTELRCNVYIGGKNGDKLYFGKPIIYDERQEHFMYPNEARLRNMTYGMTIHYDVEVEYTILSTIDNEVISKTKTFEKIFLGRFPIMLMSDYCILKGLSSSARFELGECKNDYGGYFIIDGKEKCIVSQEKFADNMIYVKDKVDETYSHSVDIRSVSEDASKPVRTLSIRIVSPSSKYTNQQIVVNVPNVRKPVPLFILMRALGIESDKDIIKYCLLDLEKNQSYIDLFIPSVHDASTFFTQDVAIEFIATFTKGKTVAHTLEILTNYLLPHIGEMNFKDKAYYIGHMVKELLMVYTGDKKPTDRDNFRFKRVELPGSLIYDLFKEYYTKQQKSIFLTLDKRYHLNRENGTFDGEKFFNLVDIFAENPFKEHIVYDGFKKAFKGNWGAEAHTKRLGVVQTLNRLSYNSALSHLRKLNLPLDASAKVVGPRLLHSSQWGIIDPVDTPDGGNIGLHKHMSISASITSGQSSRPIIDWLIRNINVSLLSENTPEIISKMAKIFVNGIWIGCVNDPDHVVEYMKKMRRIAVIPVYISISWSISENVIDIYTDAGRLCRPIFYIENGVPSFDRDAIIERLMTSEAGTSKAGTRTSKAGAGAGISWIQMLTGFAKKKDENYSIYRQHIYDKWTDLYDANKLEDVLASKSMIEYMDTSEAETALIAMDKRSMILNAKPYTHLEIHPSLIMGTMGNQIVFPENNPYARNAFACGQMRQAISLYHTNHQTRIDKMGVVLNYGQVPLVKSRYLEKLNNEQNPYGENAIVAIMSFNGYNVEDSILFNEGSVKRGLFRMTYYNMYETHEETANVGGSKINSHFINVEQNNVERLKVGYDYSHLDEQGLIKENTKLDDKKVLIGSGVLSAARASDAVYIDKSIFPKKGQLGYVDKSFMTEGEKGYRIAKVKVRDERYPYIGDKFCSRCGQKGTVGLIIPEEDMPFTADGIRPDLIINPHAIPSRMTIGQLIETIMGKACSIYGSYGDSTAYMNKGSKIQVFGDMLTKVGFHSSGNEVLYNGQTGEQFSTEIFIGPTYYMRLKHMVKDKINYRARGPRTNLTRQTVQGRANDGGLRIGEMERDGVLAHGASIFLQESLMVRGDEYYMAVCNKSGMVAIYNESKNMFLSPMCDGPLKFNKNIEDGTMNIDKVSKHGRSFSIIRVPYAFKLLVQELQTINTQIRIITDENIDQLSSMSFSNNIIKLKGVDEMGIKTKKVLSKITPDEYDEYKSKLFGSYIKDNRQMLVDETTTTKTTYKIANDMTNEIIEAIISEYDDYDIDASQLNIVDATADIGVNSMAFMRKFGHVDAVDFDTRILKHNLDLFATENKISVDRFQIYQGDFNDVIKSENVKKDVIFIEPEPDTDTDIGKKDNENNIMMGEFIMEEVVMNMMNVFPFVVVKLPLKHRELFERNEEASASSASSFYDVIRPIFTKKYSNTKVLMFHSHMLHNKLIETSKSVNRENTEINTYSRMNAESLGWYLDKDISEGLVFKSIILDSYGVETDEWVVNKRDGKYPNIPPIGWNSSDLMYEDGSRKSIPVSFIINGLRENFTSDNWNTVVKMIKTGTGYNNDKHDDSKLVRLPNEHIPSNSSDNYIPYSPLSLSPINLAKSTPLPELLNQLSDVQNKINNYAAVNVVNAANVANATTNTIANATTNAVVNATNATTNAVANAANVANVAATNVATNAANVANATTNALANLTNTATNVANSATNIATNAANAAATNASNVVANATSNAGIIADNVGNKIMDVVEGDKPILSVLTDIATETTKKINPTENKSDVKKITI